jgi:hypothetical protein
MPDHALQFIPVEMLEQAAGDAYRCAVWSKAGGKCIHGLRFKEINPRFGKAGRHGHFLH